MPARKKRRIVKKPVLQPSDSDSEPGSVASNPSDASSEENGPCQTTNGVGASNISSRTLSAVHPGLVGRPETSQRTLVPPLRATQESFGGSSVPLASQRSTQPIKAPSDLSATEISLKVNNLVQYLLIVDQKKQPIKRNDISKMVLKDHSKFFPYFINEAQTKLKRVFGIDVLEVDWKKQKAYILVNMLDNDQEDPHIKWTEEDNSKTALLIIVLSFIFMNGNQVTEASLYTVLKKFEIDADRTHAVFGDIKKLLTIEFTRQGYVEYNRVNQDPPEFAFEWGPRAKVETSKRAILDFVSQVYGMVPEQWQTQWFDAHADSETQENLGENENQTRIQSSQVFSTQGLTR